MAARHAFPLFLFLAGALAGCASGGEAFDQRMSGYLGRSETELVGGLGVPSRTYEAPGGARLLQYDFAGTGSGVAPGIGLGLGFGSFGFGRGGVGTGIGLGFGGPVAPAVTSCAATFEIRDGRVASFQRRGDDCPAAV